MQIIRHKTESEEYYEDWCENEFENENEYWGSEMHKLADQARRNAHPEVTHTIHVVNANGSTYILPIVAKDNFMNWKDKNIIKLIEKMKNVEINNLSIVHIYEGYFI
ncbi:MAG: hypothetical protein PHR17_10425 [Aminobacterium sp.]|nr:hypothetical protein [Aminobacterium sp.]